MEKSDPLLRLTQRCHTLTAQDWAMVRLLHESRERLNAGKTAGYQNRDTAQDPNRNSKVTRAGIAGEVIMMRLLEDFGVHASAREYLQQGMLHADIREAQHKGQADMVIEERKIDIKVNRLFAPTEKGYACNINRVKHDQLVANGLDGYIFVAVQDLSSVCYISRLIPHQEVARWPLVERENAGADFFSGQLRDVARVPSRLIYNRSELFRPKFSAADVEAVFQDQSFGDTIRSKFPHITWSLVSWQSKSHAPTWTP